MLCGITLKSICGRKGLIRLCSASVYRKATLQLNNNLVAHSHGNVYIHKTVSIY